MFRRPLRTAIGTTAGLLLAAWIAEFWWFARFSDDSNFTLWLWSGRVEFCVYDRATAISIPISCYTAPERADFKGFSQDVTSSTWLGIDWLRQGDRNLVDLLGGLPEIDRPANEFWCISVPNWLILLVLIALIFLTRPRADSTLRGLCSVCRYDLTGNVSGRCSECGTLRKLGATSSN